MGIQNCICIFVFLTTQSWNLVRCAEPWHEQRCTVPGSNEFISDCTECNWKEGCGWCMDKDPVPDEDPYARFPGTNADAAKIVKGCLKESANCNEFLESKVDTKNDERNEKLKQYLDKKNENGLMPNSLTDANVETPILLSPKTDGEVLFRIKINTTFPVDLYALMDLSGSMDVHRKNLINAAKEVAKTIEKDTKDFRFGFGGFRDKPRSPFGGVNDCPKYDVGFILDESGSLSSNQFEKEKKFVKNVAQLINVNRNEGRGAVVTFSDEADLDIEFSDNEDYNSFATDVDGLIRSGGGTDIIGALEEGLDEMFQTRNGMRPESEKLAFLITDGDSNSGKTADRYYDEMKKKYQNKNIRLFVIGIGNVHKRKLRKLVDNNDDFIFIDNFNNLDDVLVKSVGQSICKVGAIESDYAYHHIQEFTTDTNTYQDALRKTTCSGGGDDFESGMDGLMQTIACEDIIWKHGNVDQNSRRKILVYLTDEGAHSGRDGYHSGLLKPADYHCHLKKCTKGEEEDPSGCPSANSFKGVVWSYRDQLERDYPSFSQVRAQINKNHINMVFAVVNNTETRTPIRNQEIHDFYTKFANFIGQENSVGELTEEQDVMEALIKEKYRKITRMVRVLDDTEHNSDVKIRFKLDMTQDGVDEFNCPTENGFAEDYLQCSDITNSDTIWIEAHLDVSAESCKKSPAGKKNIRMFQFENENLELPYECEMCDCAETPEKDAPACNRKGNLVCGACQCQDGWKGRFCECEESEEIGTCDPQCENGGACECGQCECQEGFEGKCCQCKDCDKGFCAEEEDEFCGGVGEDACSGNGNCLLSCTLAECDSKVTGACNCSCGTSEEENCWGTSGKTGKFCNCCLRGPCQTHCFNRYANGKDEKNMCSEEGTCSCDFTGDAKQKVGEKCKCKQGFTGRYCQQNTQNDICELLEPCVKNRMMAQQGSGKLGEWKDQCKTNLDILKFAGEKGESMVQIGCHELKQGNLSEHIYFTSKAQPEEQEDYCETVLKEVENPVQKTSVISRSNRVIKRSDDETTSANENLETGSVFLRELQQCIMTGSEESGCKGCSIRFYHNGIDRDDIFDPTKDGRKNEPQVYVAMHNLETKDGGFSFCLDCDIFPFLPVLLSAIGVVLAILLALLIAAICIININDYRRYQQYLVNKKEAERTMTDCTNPHFVDPNTETQNPLFQQSAQY